MKSLSETLFGAKPPVDQALVQEYYERNKRKADDEKWLKANKPAILTAMQEAEKDKADFDNYRVSISTPDESKFDLEKVLEFLENQPDYNLYDKCTRIAVNEEALAAAVEEGLIDLEALKATAWIEKSGTPRLSVKQL